MLEVGGDALVHLLLGQALGRHEQRLAADVDRVRVPPVLAAEVGEIARLRPAIAVRRREPAPRLEVRAGEEVQLEPERREERQPHRDPRANVVRQEEVADHEPEHDEPGQPEDARPLRE
jgi:hypothetical protein